MKLSLNWLKEYVDISVSPEALAERLTLAGIEVEHITDFAKLLDGVFVGEIKDIKKHKNADKLSVAKVDVGEKTIQVIFGQRAAVAVGNKIPVARAPIELPLGKIKKQKIRGEVSEGMLCLDSELHPELDDTLTHFTDEVQAGEPVVGPLHLDDVVMDLALTPNRSDCFSVWGVAREVAALYGKKLIPQKSVTPLPVQGAKNSMLQIGIEEKALCPKFCALYMKNITVGESPKWLKARLELLGIRAINTIVDITNYITIGLGQPLHAFDAAKIPDHYITVRKAHKGETLVTLDGQKRVLEPDMLVLADKKQAIDVAGIMGGKSTEIGPGTTDIILVACVFDPASIRLTYRRLGLRTEASIRFEKGIDGDLREKSLRHTADMIRSLDTKASVVEGIARVVASRAPRPITFGVDLEYINRRLGKTFTSAQVGKTLQSLGIGVRGKPPKRFELTIPSWRHDLRIPADIVEEVGRMDDYNNLEPTPIVGHVVPPKENYLFRFKQDLATLMQSLGYSELYTYSFYGDREKEYVEENRHFTLTNPINPDQVYLRHSLIPLLLRKASRNLRFYDAVNIFEIGTVFKQVDGELMPKEEVMLTGVHSDKGCDVYQLYRRVKGQIEYLLTRIGVVDVLFEREENFIDVRVDNTWLGQIIIVGPNVRETYKIRQEAAVFNFDISALLELSSPKKQYVPIPEFPSVVRDVSFIVPDDVHYVKIVEKIRGQSEYVSSVTLIDEYRLKSGERSLTLRIFYTSEERTLEGAAVELIEKKLFAVLSNELGLVLRK